jgi:hypothetical protein
MSLASDIVDLLSLLNETQIQESSLMVYFTLTIFSWSLFQFCLNLVVARGRSFQSELIDPTIDEIDQDDSDDSEQTKYEFDSSNDKSGDKKKNLCSKFWKTFNAKLLNSEVWSILVTLMFQDGPFFALRLTAVIYFGVRTFVTMFFTCKNAIILFLQLYRLSSIYLETDKESESLEIANSLGQPNEQITENLISFLKNNPLLLLSPKLLSASLENQLVKIDEITCYCSCHNRQKN